ncbi:MAG: AI-2E family transporter [Alistipes sp.]|nr:AI-2E family transporter [Alistipes sp.]MBR7169964.1 AI-2E family transporter [Alistipes sp.]
MNLQTFWKVLIGLAITAAVLFLVWYFASVVIYVLISAVLAVVGRPLVRKLEGIKIHRWHLSRTLAAVITLLTIWAVGALAGYLFVPLVFEKLARFSEVDYAHVLGNFDDQIAYLQDYIATHFHRDGSSLALKEALISNLREWINIESVNRVLSSIVGLLTSSVIALFSISFITFFFLKEDGLFYAMVKAMFPERYAENIQRALDSATYLLSRYFRGLLCESLLLMLAVSLVMYTFGMEPTDAVFIGLIMGVMNVVPYAGPLIGGILSSFVGIVSPIEGMSIGQTMMVIICSLLIIKGLDDFILQPSLYSERVKAHPLEVFLVILLAGSAAGIVGMLLAIPGYTVLRVFAKEFFSQVSLVRKLTENI